MQIRFLPEAEAELLEAASWYREQAPGLDHEFMRCVDDALAMVGRVPRIFPVVHRQLRRALVRRVKVPSQVNSLREISGKSRLLQIAEVGKL